MKCFTFDGSLERGIQLQRAHGRWQLPLNGGIRVELREDSEHLVEDGRIIRSGLGFDLNGYVAFSHEGVEPGGLVHVKKAPIFGAGDWNQRFGQDPSVLVHGRGPKAECLVGMTPDEVFEFDISETEYLELRV